MTDSQLFMVMIYCLACAARHAAGQGLVPSSIRVGATNTLTQLQQQYKHSQAWKRAYKHKPRSACGRSGGASLCAAQGTSATDVHAQLMLATSPQAYSSTSSSAPRLVSPALDQAECQACTAFAVAAAAETAMAAALQVDVQQCSISVQALFFCAPNEPTRSCESGWSLREALLQLQQRGRNLPTASCLPYKPDFLGYPPAADLCSGRCDSPSSHAGSGSFSSQQINSVWRAQWHIRQYGAVVSRFDVYSDFSPFFDDRRNAKAVYRRSATAQFKYYHAITLVGYSNEQQYWLAKNSYGSSWGDNGLFKVAYGVGTIMAADGEAYGIVWTPSSTPAALQLPVTPGPRADCYWYKARLGDHLSKIAWLAGIPLDKFLLDNIDQVKDLDAPLQGLQLLLCKPMQGKVSCSVDSTGVMRNWTRADVARGGYCKWEGVWPLLVRQAKLPYRGFKALEPSIDAETMRLHYGTHYAGCVTELNAALSNARVNGIDLIATDLTTLIKSVGSLPAPLSSSVRIQGGAAWNHALYFKQLAPPTSPSIKTSAISQQLSNAIRQSFGSVDNLKTQLTEAASKLSGSGWAWLCYTGNGALAIMTTPNQDNPLMGNLPGAPALSAPGCIPILGIDVWEHAYQFKHGPKRADYLLDFWKVLSWQAVSNNYANAAAGKVSALVA